MAIMKMVIMEVAVVKTMRSHHAAVQAATPAPLRHGGRDSQ